MFGVVLKESTDESSQLWKSEVEMEEEEKYGYVWRRRTSETQAAGWKALGESSHVKKRLLDSVTFMLP